MFLMHNVCSCISIISVDSCCIEVSHKAFFLGNRSFQLVGMDQRAIHTYVLLSLILGKDIWIINFSPFVLNWQHVCFPVAHCFSIMWKHFGEAWWLI